MATSTNEPLKPGNFTVYKDYVYPGYLSKLHGDSLGSHVLLCTRASITKKWLKKKKKRFASNSIVVYLLNIRAERPSDNFPDKSPTYRVF